MLPCMSFTWTRRLSQVAKSQLARGRPVIECSSCHATVKPTKKINWWVAGLLLVLIWPGAILYVLTRPANTCPICGSRIQVPHHRPSVTVRQEEPETPISSNPAPSSPREVMAASWRRHRKMILISWGGVLGMVVVLASLLVLASNGGGGSAGKLPDPALQDPTTRVPARVRATATPTISDGQRLQQQNRLLADCINLEMANGNITSEQGNVLIRRALNVQNSSDTFRLSVILQCVQAGYR